jgi:hypothetical protein
MQDTVKSCLVVCNFATLASDLGQTHITTDGQSVSVSWCGARSGSCDQIVFFFPLPPQICCLVSVGRPLWREVGSVICQSFVNTVYSSQSVFTSNIYIKATMIFMAEGADQQVWLFGQAVTADCLARLSQRTVWPGCHSRPFSPYSQDVPSS